MSALEERTSAVQQAARDYLSRGWIPIPAEPNSKQPRIRDWTNYTPSSDTISADFAVPRMNIGVLMGTRSQGLVDIDLDCTVAVRLAPDFLPPTAWVHGREGLKSSHYFYIAKDSKTRKFLDPIDQTVLVELRAGGLARLRFGGVPRVPHG